jgi:hypothetical protein
MRKKVRKACGNCGFKLQLWEDGIMLEPSEGGHAYRSDAEIIEALKARGLPVVTHSDGAFFMTEDALDRWFEGLGSVSEGLVVSPERFSVEYLGKTCFLGNTRIFRLAERLHRSRGNYVSYSFLVQDVWDGYQVENVTIHQAVRVLRRKLRAAGMPLRIVAQPNHYALQLQT